ncbi:major facilitator superfamily domain-containing protein [Aspergillus pseudocaelatus]|uniref:Major facilitator superfamily domain-containing protein n=1 Tax=Aspergillus pseudocaelatus TaxID=1825620 RepID=A0ABQ6WV23_9EURO|nr:major facilitator superfamily domain-containing protein [Aspergillus pseudocaelatus]
MSSPSRPWYRIRWFADEDTAEERRLIVKLDLLIVPYAFLAYWVKYIDQANINNAYVSGVKEDLNLQGNDLVQLQTMYTVGAVVGQIPFVYLFTKLPISWLIPILDIAWGVFTLLQFRASSFGELAAYRFLVGWFEAAFFPGMHYIFGAWYRGDEIARRGGCFYVGLTLGTLTASLIQSGASARLDGVHGLAGWRWMYIVCAIITIPIGILGFFILPGTPDKPNRMVLRPQDVDLAKARLVRVGHGFHPGFQWRSVINIVRNWKFWAMLWLDIFFWNACLNTTAGGYLLWLKSLNRFSTARLNELSAISPALGIFYTLFICFASDLVLGPAWAITVSHIWNIIGLVILVVWNVPESAKWFAFQTTYAAVAMSSVLYGWINSELRASPAERSLALVITNTIAQSTTVWTPLLVFKTVEGPRFTKGYSFTLASAICLIATAHLIQKGQNIQTDRESSVGTPVQVQTKVSL